MTTTVRPIQPQDHAQWLPLWQAYLTFYEAHLSAEQTQRTWERLNDPQFNLHGLVAEQDGQLVGITHYLFHPSSWADEPYCYLEDLYVASNARRNGTGKLLIKAVAEKAKIACAKQVYWLTHNSNTRAQRLYNSIEPATGFVHYSIDPRGFDTPSTC